MRQRRFVAHKVKVNDAVTCLSTSGQEVNHLLDRTGAVHVQGDVDEVLRDRFANQIALLIGTVLQQLLAQVVSKGICTRISIKESGFGVTALPVISSAKCPNVSLKIISRCSGRPSSSFFCR